MMISESNSHSSKLTAEIFDALWKILDSIRGTSDISEFKDLVLAFLFIKYISDLDLDHSENQSSIVRFKLPKNSNFYAIHAQRHELHLVENVEQALRAFEEANPEFHNMFESVRLHLKNTWRRGEANRYALRGIIELFAQPQLSFRSNETNPKLAV